MDHPPANRMEPRTRDALSLLLENRPALIRYAVTIVGDVGLA